MQQTNEQIQIQTQQQIQQQRLTAQQVLYVRMLEMPLAQLEDNIRAEVDSNPSLEATEMHDDDAMGDSVSNAPMDDNAADDATDDYTNEQEKEDRQEALEQALDSFGQDDRMDTDYSDNPTPRAASNAEEDRRMEDGDVTSFIDTLNEQMRMEVLSPQQEQIMEYLIGSLDDDGLLRKDLMTIADELAIYRYVDVTEEQILEVLEVLQTFDPAGIGARSLQECLLLQVKRKSPSWVKHQLKVMLTDHYEDFINNRMGVVRQKMELTEYEMEEVMAEVKKLNPKPGAALGEAQGRALNQITPDFIVYVDYDGRLTFEVNNGRMPRLNVVSEDEMLLQEWKQREKQKGLMTAGEREAMAFTVRNVDRANDYILSLRQRQQAMTQTMKAIIHLQRQYFLEGDENDLKPMRLKDVAEITGLDISTVSRVCNAKYVQTPWGIFSLRHFFGDSYTTKDGATLSTKLIKNILRELIEAEDARHPLSDEKLCKVMAEKGFTIARRTVTKYREKMGIPTARLRKK